MTDRTEIPKKDEKDRKTRQDKRMNYIGETVVHKTLGTGKVIDQSGNKITVKFAEKEAKFVFPDCFESILTFSDSGIQESVEDKLQEKNEEKRKIEKAEAEKKETERYQRRKLTERYVSIFDRPRSSGSSGVYILNFQSPSTYDDLKNCYELYNKETNLEGLFSSIHGGSVIWSVPDYARKGELVLFHCAVSSSGS